MNASEKQDLKNQIIQEVLMVEEEWIIKAICKLLDIDFSQLGESKSFSNEDVENKLGK